MAVDCNLTYIESCKSTSDEKGKEMWKKFLMLFKGWTKLGMIEYLKSEGYTVTKRK